MPEFYREPNRDVGISIEGKIELPFREIDIYQASPIPLPASIQWPNEHTALSFQKVDEPYIMPADFGRREAIDLYYGYLTHVDPKGGEITTDLSNVIAPGKPILFTGTRNGFYAHDPLMLGLRKRFYIIGIQLRELQKSITKLSPVLHEMGHVQIFHHDLDTLLLHAAITKDTRNLPDVALSLSYCIELARALTPQIQNIYKTRIPDRYDLTNLENQNSAIRLAMALFHERNAWAAGAHISKRYKIPTGFDLPQSYLIYSQYCLETYAKYYKDARFVKGMKHRGL